MMSLVPLAPVQFEYRIYYDQFTNECTFKTTESPDGKFIVLTREEYDNVTFCPDYYISKLGKLTKKRLEFTTSKMLQLDDHGYKAVRNNNIFAVGDSYVGEVDHWTLRNLNE